MKLNELKVPKKATVRASKRRGRGAASGIGGTAGRGHKGQKALSGGKVRIGFEGGQMPITRRVPKRGFFNIFRVSYKVVNLADIAKKQLKGEIDPKVLKSVGLIRGVDVRVKILGDGVLDGALTVKAHAFSKSAREKIEKAGGKVEVIS
jgi:large subunit ribosomal protein L15